MKNNCLHQKMVVQTILFILLLSVAGMTKAMAQTYPALQTEGTAASLTSATINARTVGVIPYSEDFITQEEVVERNYAITSFRMIDTATVAVLTGASDMILVHSLTDNQILHKIKLPISARAFDYDDGVFHVVGDRTYLSMDQEGFIHERKDFQQPNKEFFIITDLKTVDGQPIIHECEANTYSVTSDGLQEIDTFYYHHARGCKIYPKYNDESSFTLYDETPSQRGNINVTMESLGLEGKLSCLDEISVDDDFIAINLQTTYNRTGSFVKSYLLVVNHNGELINLVEVPINFLSYISKPFLYKDNAWYYAFSGQEGITFFKIDTNTNNVDTPDPSVLSDENIDYFHSEPEMGTSGEETNNDSTRGNWRTITQAWYNANKYCTLDWTPISSNVATSCTWVGGSGYIKTPITSYGYTETGVPYKWGGYTSWRNFESLASQGKYTGNRVTTSSTCGGNAYSADADTYVLGVDCSGYVSRCWEVAHKTTSSIPNICTSQGLVTSASSSAFRNMDALNNAGSHVMLYRSHNGSNQVIVFESSANDWKTSGRTYNISYFSGYYIQRLNYMKNIILRLNSAITLSQNGSTVTNVTQGQPLTVNYSVKNFGSETWTGYVRLYIEQSDGDLMSIKSDLTTLYSGESESFTFSNQGVISPTGTTKLYVKLVNSDASDFGEPYDAGDGGYANPKVFNIIDDPTPACNDCPDYDETWNILSDDEWQTRSSSISSNGCRTYRVALLPSYTYTFQTCSPGTATFDTKLYLYNASCNEKVNNDDACGTLSSLTYTNTGNAAYYYLKIVGYNGAGGSFTIAGKRESPTIYYDISASASPLAGGTVSGAGTYESGSNCTLTATPNTGYTFTNWTKNGSQVSTSTTYSFTVTEDASYVANFSQNSYSISASASPSNGGSVSGGGSYNHGTSCTLTATANTGYTFTNWTKNGQQVSTSSTYSFTVTEAGNYVANFSQNSYTISASASPSNGGSVSGGGSYNHGSSCTLTASPNTGYSFTNWTKNGQQVSTSTSYTFTVTESASYVANFSQNSYTISASASPSNGGSVSGGGSYNHGSSCTLTASPNTGYTFTNWTKNGSQVSTSTTYSFTVTESASYVANFSQNSYTISASASPSNGGSVSGGGSYNYGSSCTLTASPNTGYTFTNWTKNGQQVSTSASYTFTVTESASYVANFSQNSYTISASANPSNGGSVSGGGSYNQGSNCTLTATANTGYTFSNWTEGGVEVSTNSSYSFTVNGNRTLVANFVSSQSDYHWTIEGSQYAGTMTVVGVIQINGEEQAMNTLELGAFCGAQCRGRERLSYVSQLNRYLLFLTLYGNDGDLLNFRLYNHSLGQELDLTCTSTITFATNATMGTSTNPYVFNFMDGLTQTTSLTEGWNWWSCYVELSDIDGLSQMEESLGDNGIMIKSRNDGFVINSYGMWLGQLSAVNNESTYLIQTSAACDMTVTGNAVTPSAHPITLSPGWSWIGYPCTTPMSVSEAMSGLTPMADDLLKSRESFAVYTPGIGWLGTLSTITPGMGLMFESHNTSPVTLIYPNPSKSEALLENITAKDNHWEPEMQGYAQNMSVMAIIELDGEELEGGQYELAAFSNGECRGSAKLMYVEPIHKYMAFLTVYGEGGEELGFGLYDVLTGAETYESSESLVFEANAVVGAVNAPFVVRFGGMTGMDDFGSHIHLFPNPVGRGDRVSLGMAAEDFGVVQIEVINALGAVLSVETSTKQPVSIKAPDVAGAYTLRITVEGKETCYRKLVVR